MIAKSGPEVEYRIPTAAAKKYAVCKFPFVRCSGILYPNI